jgi:phenylpropionate dioxygenase-like ring-hydroxylating dioxygenase large terminal subunit
MGRYLDAGTRAGCALTVQKTGRYIPHCQTKIVEVPIPMNAERSALSGGSSSPDLQDRIEACVNRGLLGHWYVVAKSADIAPGDILAVKALGRDLVLWRAPDGQLNCVEDRCPHRGARLSHGRVREEGIACRYHGVTIDATGRICEVPALGPCALQGRAAVTSYPVREASDGVFAYFASAEHPQPRDFPLPVEIDSPEHASFLCTSVWECNYRYATENLADPMHGIYLHANSFTLGSGATQDTVELEPTPQGFIVRRVAQQGINFDWVEIVARPPVFHARVVIPYPKAGGPGPAMTVICFVTPIDERSCRIFFWRTRKVQGLAAETWRFLFRSTFEARHWTVLEQDREMLAAMHDDARSRELLYQHDIGVVRLRRYFAQEARRQVEAEGAPAQAVP